MGMRPVSISLDSESLGMLQRLQIHAMIEGETLTSKSGVIRDLIRRRHDEIVAANSDSPVEGGEKRGIENEDRK